MPFQQREFDGYIRPDGKVIEFNREFCVTEASGFGPPRQQVGATLSANGRPLAYSLTSRARTIIIDFMYCGCSRCDYWATAGGISNVLNPTFSRSCSGSQPGRLFKNLEDGSRWEIEAFFVRGLDLGHGLNGRRVWNEHSIIEEIRFTANIPEFDAKHTQYLPVALSGFTNSEVLEFGHIAAITGCDADGMNSGDPAFNFGAVNTVKKANGVGRVWVIGDFGVNSFVNSQPETTLQGERLLARYDFATEAWSDPYNFADDVAIFTGSSASNAPLDLIEFPDGDLIVQVTNADPVANFTYHYNATNDTWASLGTFGSPAVIPNTGAILYSIHPGPDPDSEILAIGYFTGIGSANTASGSAIYNKSTGLWRAADTGFANTSQNDISIDRTWHNNGYVYIIGRLSDQVGSVTNIRLVGSGVTSSLEVNDVVFVKFNLSTELFENAGKFGFGSYPPYWESGSGIVWGVTTSPQGSMYLIWSGPGFDGEFYIQKYTGNGWRTIHIGRKVGFAPIGFEAVAEGVIYIDGVGSLDGNILSGGAAATTSGEGGPIIWNNGTFEPLPFNVIDTPTPNAQLSPFPLNFTLIDQRLFVHGKTSNQTTTPAYMELPACNDIFNPYSSDALVKFEVQGPNKLVEIVNETTGASIKFLGSNGGLVIDNSQTVTIDLLREATMSPNGYVTRSAKVYDNNGTNLLEAVSPSSDLDAFSIAPGRNIITAYVRGNSPVNMTIKPRTQTPTPYGGPSPSPWSVSYGITKVNPGTFNQFTYTVSGDSTPSKIAVTIRKVNGDLVAKSDSGGATGSLSWDEVTLHEYNVSIRIFDGESFVDADMNLTAPESGGGAVIR